MKITKEWLEENNACPCGIKWFINQKETDGLKVVKKLIAENGQDWANWLIVRLMKYEQYLAYAIYAVELVLPIYEQKYSNDNSIREVVLSTKKYINSPTQKNKQAVSAAYAAADAASAAADAADAASAAADAADAVADAAYAVHKVVSAASAAANVAYAAYAASAAANVAYAAYAASAAADAVAYAVAYAASVSKKEIQVKTLNYGLELLEAKK